VENAPEWDSVHVKPITSVRNLCYNKHRYVIWMVLCTDETSMKHLWSPWRMSYILNNQQEEGCVFCNAQEGPDCPENLVVFRGERAYVILNRFPYTSGHLMVVPYSHQPTLYGLDCETRAEMMELVTRCIQVLQLEYKAQGYNIGANIGGAAGAGIPKHIHFHIVPRWQGDTNFMSALGDTRVVPEALSETYHRIRTAWEKIFKQP
jgi:ATP adenylyltransferase